MHTALDHSPAIDPKTNFQLSIQKKRVLVVDSSNFPKGARKDFLSFIFKAYRPYLKPMLRVAKLADYHQDIAPWELEKLIEVQYSRLAIARHPSPQHSGMKGQGCKGLGIHHIIAKVLAGLLLKNELHAINNLCLMPRRTELLFHTIMHFINPHIAETRLRKKSFNTDAYIIFPNTHFWPLGIGKTWLMIEKELQKLQQNLL